MTRRVLHVLAPATYGGLERVVQSLASEQRARGHEVHAAPIMELGEPEPPLLCLLRRDDVQVHPIATPARAYLAQAHALNVACRAIQPDVIHAHGYVADVLLAMSNRSRSTPRVSTVHGFTGGGMKNRAYEWMQRRAFRRFDAVVAVSARLGRELVADGLRSDRVHVIANAFPVVTAAAGPSAARRALDIPEHSFSIGWVGRVSQEKGLDVLINALQALHGIDWRLTVLGDGRERQVLQRRVAELGLAERVSWRGAVANASDLVRAFDVLVISSRTEGTPMTLFEAMTASVPLVATAVGGIPDVVSSDEALLVPADDPDALADAIRSVQQGAFAAGQRAARAYIRLRRDYAIGPFVEAYDRVYDSLKPRE